MWNQAKKLRETFLHSHRDRRCLSIYHLKKLKWVSAKKEDPEHRTAAEPNIKTEMQTEPQRSAEDKRKFTEHKKRKNVDFLGSFKYLSESETVCMVMSSICSCWRLKSLY